MQECVYGWYPPANDPWKTYRDPGRSNPYDQEYLYRHLSSKYNDQTGVSTPQLFTPARMSASNRQTRLLGTAPVHQTQLTPDINQVLLSSVQPPPRSRSRASSRPASRIASRKGSHNGDSRAGSVAASGENLFASIRIDGRTPAGAPVNLFSPPAPSRPVSVKSNSYKKPWATKVAETTLQPHPPSEVRETIAGPPQTSATRLNTSSSKPSRIQSATAYRPRVTPPSRPVQSANPIKRTPHDASAALDDVKSAAANAKEEDEEDGDDVNVEDNDEDDEELGVDDPLDYDEQLERCGWRMEVPGDPLNLKRPCLAKRHKYSASVPVPGVAPNPPKCHMESSETFFSNTIPRQPMTVTIHRDWASEVLCAKRLELQKRDGDRYKYRTHFMSFIY